MWSSREKNETDQEASTVNQARRPVTNKMKVKKKKKRKGNGTSLAFAE